MFWKNDRALLRLRGVMQGVCFLVGALGVIGGLVLTVEGNWLGIALAVAAPLFSWLVYLWCELLFSLCADIKFIRNQIYQLRNYRMEEFLDRDD
ncbi:MAG: hypothetical protein IJW29_09115 [Clostridia bacterium]|nr:hypothetical protein [Clostridia bacterium]